MTPQCREILDGAAEFYTVAGPGNVLETVYVPTALYPAAHEAHALLPGVRFVHDADLDGMVFVARDPESVN